MRHVLSLLALAGLLSMAAPAAAQIVRKGDPRPADLARLRAEVGEAARTWTVEARAASGAVTRLRGRIALEPGAPEAKLAEFVRRFGPLFDVGAPGSAIVELEEGRVLAWHADGSPRVVVARQSVEGFRVPGHGIWLELDRDGSGLGAHGIVSDPAARTAAPRLTEEAALGVARAHLVATGRGETAWRSAPRIAGRLTLPAPVARRVYSVGLVLHEGLTPLRIDVDATTGAIVSERIDRETFLGEGNFPLGGGSVPFETGNGKGIVYKDFKRAAANAPASQSLPEIAFESPVPGFAEDGQLLGRYAWVLQAEDDQLTFFSVILGLNHAFFGSPFLPQFADLFDATNTYFHLTKFAQGMTKLFGGALPTDFAMPTVVNLPGLLNAFFSTQDLGIGTGPGFMAFGDLSVVTNVLGDDFGRDPSIMYHEYTHAITGFAGIDFGGSDLNHPPRAVNEAIADYFAAAFMNDPRIGLALAQLAGPDLFAAMGLQQDGLRNLAAPLTLLGNIDDLLVEGIPEEHVGGHIFGCALFRLRAALKKKADVLVLFSIFNWPQTTAEVGFPVVDANNAFDAYAAYFEACAATLVDDAEFLLGAKGAQKVLGALMVNDVIGSPFFGTGYVLDGSAKGTITIDSAFLGPETDRLFAIFLEAGRTLDVTVQGSSKDGTLVDFELFGPPGGLFLPTGKKVTGGGKKVSLAKMQVLETDVYLVIPERLGFAQGRYRLQIKVK